MELPRYAGLTGLRAADPVELAVALFEAVFATVNMDRPFRPVGELNFALAELSGVRSPRRGLMVWLGLATDAPSALTPYAVQSKLIWERALIVGSGLSNDRPKGTPLILLPRGEELRRSMEPVLTLRSWLTDPGDGC